MLSRTAVDQSKHDYLIRVLASIYEAECHNVRTNPGREHNEEFHGVYPDVVVGIYNEFERYWLFEVETEESVNDAEAEQWEEYSKLFKYYLVIPASLRATARNIITARKLKKISIVTYKYNEDGSIDFKYLPGV